VKAGGETEAYSAIALEEEKNEEIEEERLAAKAEASKTATWRGGAESGRTCNDRDLSTVNIVMQQLARLQRRQLSAEAAYQPGRGESWRLWRKALASGEAYQYQLANRTVAAYWRKCGRRQQRRNRKPPGGENNNKQRSWHQAGQLTVA
jgi:hypothetical protein